MKPLFVRDPVDCGALRRLVHAYLDGELAVEDVVRLDAHLEGCGACRDRLEVERGITRALKRRLAPVATPAGLEGRIRDALGREVSAGKTESAVAGNRRFTPVAVAAAAAIAMALLFLPELGRSPRREAIGPAATVVQVARDATVVDVVCDQAGASITAQRGCRDPRHLNALRLADGTYWAIVIADDRSRSLVLDPAHRGQRARIEGSYYPAIQTVRLTRFEPVAARPASEAPKTTRLRRRGAAGTGRFS